MALLTDRTLAQSTAITPTTLIHIVTTADMLQNPAGSSYKAELGQLTNLFSGTTFTGNTSATCITDLYVSSIHSCSPLYINPLSEGNIYVGSANTLTVDLTNETVGIGTSTPSEKLDVSGKTKTTNFQMTSGATSGYVLTSLDNNGNSSWEPLSSLSGSSVISVTGVTTSAYTATTSYSYYGVEYSGVTSIEIPDATGLDGFTFRIKDERGTSSTYPITITPVTGNIDNNNYIDMQINYMSLTLVARNNNWWII